MSHPVPEYVHEAHAAKLKAEAKAFEAEANRHEVEARKVAAEAREAEVEADKVERANKAALADNNWHHVYVFDKSVGDASVTACIKKLTEWSRNDPGCDIEIIFNSPGGSVVDGMALYDFILQTKNKGHKITTSSLGYAASMAGILLQAGDVRKMGSEAWLLIHEASFGVSGSTGEVEDRVEWIKKIQERIVAIFAEKSTLSKAQIKRRWHRKDWWLDADEALALGFIDEIG